MAGKNQPSNGEPRKGYETVEKVQAEPWGPSQGYLNQILDQSQQNFNTGVGTAYPDFPTTVGLGSTSRDAIGLLSGMAGQQPGGGNYGEVYDRAMGPSAADQYLTGIASGSAQNPYLDQLLDSGSERIANQVKAAYSSKGRYGSEDFTDALARGISDYQTPIQYAAWDANRGRQLQATGMLDNTRLQGANLGLSASGMLDESRYAGADRLLNAGMYEDQNRQARRTADVERFLWENGGADQAALGNYLNTVGPIAGMGGTQQVQEPRRPGQKILGGLLTGLGAIGSFF